MKILAFAFSGGMCGSVVNLGFIANQLNKKGHLLIVPYRRKDIGAIYLKRSCARIIFDKFPFSMNTATVIESSGAQRSKIIIQTLKDIIRAPAGFLLSGFLILKHNPDIVFLADSTFPQIALSALCLGKPIVCQIQSEIIRGNFNVRRKLTIKILNKSQKIFAITQRHLDPFVKNSKERSRYQVIPNTAVLENRAKHTAAPKIEEKIKTPGKYKKIIFLGGDITIKGFKLVKEIAREAQLLNKKYFFTAAGPTEKISVNKNFASVGEQINVIDFVRDSDLLIVANLFPHFSRPIVEAFATRTPVLAIDDVFNREIICDEKYGFLIKSRNPRSWIKKIGAIFSEKKKCRKVVNKAFELYRRKYHHAVISKKIIGVFESIRSS